MQPQAKIERVRDMFIALVLGEIEIGMCPKEIELIRVALDVLCWVLENKQCDGFYKTLDAIEDVIKQVGYVEERVQ